MSAGPTWLSLFAAGIYAPVVAMAVFAAITAVKFSQAALHCRVWFGIALLFAALIALRVFDIENIVRDELRALLVDDAKYGDRRDFQRMIAAGVFALSLVGASVIFFRRLRAERGRRDLALSAAVAACGAMIVLVALRLISLHSIDALLYGPLKLNWIGDLGLSLAVGAAAVYYVKVVRALS
ncbi:hypothetical protein [Erythrobacter crassostreae]|uniref:Uncharacterized protein n=1 Tax=Erythrobacter crassostreae TaxID=2828328 RepID=A0A9X1F2F8_9SPHN|nr:hypothetical protein [Erythrobacter crassostrea]MBV7258268.1 hypothetical protein [Erythrobacter crassostrea]